MHSGELLSMSCQLYLADTRKEKDTSNLHLADCSIRGY